MTINMATHSQLSTTESKNNKLREQPEQEQNHRYGYHLEGYQLRGRRGGNLKGISSINGRYKIDRRRIRIV